MMRPFFLTFLVLLLAEQLSAQQTATESPLIFDGRLVGRFESADWFGGESESYHHNFGHTRLQLGAGYKRNDYKFYAQGQYFQLYNLPEAASGPGAVYFGANGMEESPGKVALRQAYAEFNDSKDILTLGRFLYSNGSEAIPAQPALAAVRAARVMQRLVGPFDYTSGRSFDGAKGSISTSRGAFSGIFFMPTEGGFEIDQNRTINEIKFGGLTWTDQAYSEADSDYDLQSFLYFYSDTRESLKADNRSLEQRTADSDNIEIATLGGHWTKVWNPESFTIDSLIWMAAQAGDWGMQDHLAYAFTAELGASSTELSWKPGMRLGYTLGSGDSNSEDNDHNTFFQILPTARAFALTPFYNMQNTSDLFTEFSLLPVDKLKLRSSLHWIQLTENDDALYSGGGANEVNGGFGYAARPSGGSHDVGTLLDIEASWTITPRYLISLYYGHLFGGDVTSSRNGTDRDIDYFFSEFSIKFS